MKKNIELKTYGPPLKGKTVIERDSGVSRESLSYSKFAWMHFNLKYLAWQVGGRYHDDSRESEIWLMFMDRGLGS